MIRDELVAPFVEELSKLECGIYLLARQDPGLNFLLTANKTVHDLVQTLVRESEFLSYWSRASTDMVKQILGADRLELWARTRNTVLLFEEHNGFTGQLGDPPPDVSGVLSGGEALPAPRLLLALRPPSSAEVTGSRR